MEIDIIDVNDNSPQIQIEQRVLSIEEEGSGEIEIALVLISDLDSGDNGRVDLSFNCDSFSNCRSYFMLNALTTNVYKFLLIKPLDYEKGSEVIVTFYFQDNGEIPKNGSLEVSLISLFKLQM